MLRILYVVSSASGQAMANGFHGPKNAWERITTPLVSLDEELELFASHRGVTLGKNTKNWPNREFRWFDQMERLMEIFLEDERYLTWTLWICAYEDRTDGRYWRTKTLRKAASVKKLQETLRTDLEDGWQTVTRWRPEDLYPAR